MRRVLRVLLSSGLLLAAACSAGAGPVVGARYGGETLLELGGSFEVSNSALIDGEIAIAVTWYTQITGKRSESDVVSQPATFEGQFPNVTFRIPLTGAPPPGALLNVDGSSVALGVVIAYRDLNGNGRLDVIKQGTKPVDVLLGASVATTSPTNFEGLVLGYLVGKKVEKMEGDWVEGYNVADFDDTTALPISTPIPIRVQGDWRLNQLLCERTPDYLEVTEEQPCPLDDDDDE